MGASKKKESDAIVSPEGSEPTAPESVEKAMEGPSVDAPTKPKRTRVFRGQECEVVSTTRNTRTGAIYDLIEVPRNVTNRRSGDVDVVKIGRKMRRPGTGVEPTVDEVAFVDED
jgi:hypothetical protein